MFGVGGFEGMPIKNFQAAWLRYEPAGGDTVGLFKAKKKSCFLTKNLSGFFLKKIEIFFKKKLMLKQAE